MRSVIKIKYCLRIGLFLLSIFGLFILTATLTFAQQTTAGTSNFVPLVDLPSQSSKFAGFYSAQNLSAFLNRLFFFAISLGGILAVGRLVYAGWLYTMGDMGGNIKKAKEIIGNVVIGLLLLLSIWLILNQINPEILNLSILRNLGG
ncbi:hypothetical protein HZC00_01740 [Candidatus Kaiserbacteria bacterium]|nr:hypothetical protein [Candidatus Kaiserbacteria bacterium]